MGTKRLLIATVLLVIAVLSAMPCSAASPLELLTGPVTPIGSTAYDKLQLAQGARFAPGAPAPDGFPSFGDITDSNYYDLALTYYVMYQRTQDPVWRDRARVVAQAFRDECVAIWPNSAPPLRAASTLGLALLYLDTGDTVAKQIVGWHADFTVRYFPLFTGGNADMRESAYGLMALLASTLIGAGDHTADAKAMLDSFIAGQKADGRWQNFDNCALNGGMLGGQPCTALVPAVYYTLNYMVGLVMESLIFYDRAIGDPRIVPAIEKALAWEWNTQWVATVPGSNPTFGAFQYADINSGSVNTNPYANLSGLLVPAWGYAYAKTGKTAYLTQGTTILQSMVAAAGQSGIPGAGIYNVKQFTQEFRSTPRYLGFTSGPVLAAPTGLSVH
jgi:hypothetical protein